MINHATSEGSFRSPLWISKGQVWEKPLSFQPGDDPIDWLEELNQAIVINEWDDRRTLAIALALLPRAVRLSFPFPESKLATFKDIEMAFRERYQDVGYKTRAFNEALN
ncbi:hypothetical protein BGZ68_004621 [Mortierella alpina]|nr:hypothetical protein BGZ68_004621 [Mortierella alpina]